MEAATGREVEGREYFLPIRTYRDKSVLKSGFNVQFHFIDGRIYIMDNLKNCEINSVSS